MAQHNKTCQYCGLKGHSKSYCKTRPRTPIKTTSKKTKKTKSKLKKVSRSQLVKKLDSVFSQYIRLKDAKDGIATCVTCGTKDEWKNMQNGHFVSRGKYSTRWSELNCHVQCLRCNVFLKGNYINYTLYMIDRYGREKVDELKSESMELAKFSSQQLKEMIDFYSGEVKKLS